MPPDVIQITLPGAARPSLGRSNSVSRNGPTTIEAVGQHVDLGMIGHQVGGERTHVVKVADVATTKPWGRLTGGETGRHRGDDAIATLGVAADQLHGGAALERPFGHRPADS